MDIKDLMIGDWVYSKLHNVRTRVIDIEGRGSVWLESSDCWERHFMSEIEPIPLDAAILEANGLDTNLTQKSMIPIEYCHQLQHLIRLLGFEKEIQL